MGTKGNANIGSAADAAAPAHIPTNMPSTTLYK